MEQIEPAPRGAFGALARGLDRGEPLAVGEEVGERGLELDAPPLVLLVRDDVEIPPGVAHLVVERGELAFDPVCNGGCVRHAAAVYGSHGASMPGPDR